MLQIQNRGKIGGIMSKKCCFCEEINGKSLWQDYNEKLVKKGKNLIYKSDNFIIVPTFGALNESHALIIPLRHLYSIAEIDYNEKNELEIIKNILRNYIKENSNRETIFFEHGSGSKGNYHGACLTHAHLHVIATKYELINKMENLNLKRISNEEFYKKDGTKDYGYIFYENIDGNFYINTKDIFPSQIMRQYISKYLTNKNEWDWRIYNKLEDILAVLKYYENVTFP